MAARKKPPRWLAVLGLVGGLTAALGCFLPWLRAGNGLTIGTTPVGGSPLGWETLPGRFALVASAVAILSGLFLITRRMPRALAVFLLLAAATAVAAGAYSGADPEARYIDFAAHEVASPQQPESDVESSLRALFRLTGQEIEPDAGAAVTIAGGVFIALSGVLTLVSAGRSRRSRLPVSSEGPIRQQQGPPATAPSLASSLAVPVDRAATEDAGELTRAADQGTRTPEALDRPPGGEPSRPAEPGGPAEDAETPQKSDEKELHDEQPPERERLPDVDMWR